MATMEELKGEMASVEQQLDAAEAREDEAEKAEAEMIEALAKDMKSQMDAKFKDIKSSTPKTEDLQARLCTGDNPEQRENLALIKEDVMRTNKVIRELSRALGPPDWQPVFTYLMAATLSKEDIKKEIERIERVNKPMMQTYKALNLWKDTREEGFGLTQLADALRINKKEQLADYVLDVVEYEGDTLPSLNQAGDKKKEEAATAGAEGEDGAKARPVLKAAPSSVGVLDDRKFLQLAKKLGSEWEALATALGLDEGDVTEILEAEGKSYQGGFKMLWAWRDRTVELDQDNAEILRNALKAAGKPDLADSV